MTLSEESFLKKLGEFRIKYLNDDSGLLVLLFTGFLVDNYDQYTLNNDIILEKISLVCEELDIDLDECLKLGKDL